jgi:hypothetical protein
MAKCHLHPERPNTGCKECVTALEVTFRSPISVIIASGLAHEWLLPGATTKLGGDDAILP